MCVDNEYNRLRLENKVGWRWLKNGFAW
jgi:hypothetical protein